MTSVLRFRRLAGVLPAAAFVLGFSSPFAAAQEPAIPTIPEVQVRFAHAAFLDQTEAIIGIRNEWFKEVGITLTPLPHGLVLPSAERAANLIAGSVDVVATGAYNLIPSMGRAQNLRVFFQKDIFRGYRIMARPDAGLKSVDEFVAEGMSFDEAFRNTVAQFKGLTITYQSEPSREQFIGMVYDLGGFSEEDRASINTVNVDDAQTIAMMVSGRADLQFSGAPAMVELTTRGYKPILSAIDLANVGTASIHSPPLTASQKVGWATTEEYMAANHDTILRMSSVGFRIVDAIRNHPEKTLPIHVAFLNSIAGSQTTEEFAKWLYDVVHPYATFEEQAAWYADPRDPMYYFYEIGARIIDAEERGILEKGQMTVDRLIVADDIYWELVELKAKAGRAIGDAHRLIEEATENGVDVARAVELRDEAARQFAAYNFLDAERFATASVEWATYLAR